MTLTSVGLTDIGAGPGLTFNFKVQYEDSLPNQAAVIANANTLLAVIENEFNVTTAWFGTPTDKFGSGNRQVVNLNLTGGGNNSGYGTAINVDATTNAESVKMVFMNEWVEILMSLSDGRWNAGNSDGEGLSQLCGILRFPVGHYRYYGSWVNAWLGSARDPQYITSPEGTDKNSVSFGCALLFLNYLLSQLGFDISEVIQGGTGTLAGTYQNLTGLTSASTPFVQLINKIFPGTSTITSGNLDNPFPKTFDGILLQVMGAGQVWVVFGNGRFAVPDAATLARLYPGTPVFPYGDFLFAINTIPDDGTLLREESSSQVWMIQARTRVLAPPGAPGTVHVLWDGALNQIPLPNGILAGVVGDPDGAPVSDATVLITSTSVIPATGDNQEQLSTDSQGRYSSSFLPPGVYQVEVLQDGFVPARTSVTILDGVPITTLNFTLERTLRFTIEGQVTDAAGGAPIGATVQLTKNSPVPEVVTATTDTSGNYSITMDPGPFDGSYTLEVAAAGFASNSVTFSIPNGATIMFNFALRKRGVLTGHVSNQQGPPLGGARVLVGSSETFTDVTGAYSIMVDPGQYSVTASAPGFTPINALIQIPSGMTVVQDFVLSQTIPGTITGTVTDDGGAPLAGARVAARGTIVTTTGGDGTYTLTNLQPGPTEVVASRGVRFIPDQEIVTVVSGETVTQDFVLVQKGSTSLGPFRASGRGTRQPITGSVAHG